MIIKKEGLIRNTAFNDGNIGSRLKLAISFYMVLAVPQGKGTVCDSQSDLRKN